MSFAPPRVALVTSAALLLSLAASFQSTEAKTRVSRIDRPGCFAASEDGLTVFCVGLAETHDRGLRWSAQLLELSREGEEVFAKSTSLLELGPDEAKTREKLEGLEAQLEAKALEKKHVRRVWRIPGRHRAPDRKKWAKRAKGERVLRAPDKASEARIRTVAFEGGKSVKLSVRPRPKRSVPDAEPDWGPEIKAACPHAHCQVLAAYYVDAARVWIFEVHALDRWEPGDWDRSISFRVLGAPPEPE